MIFMPVATESGIDYRASLSYEEFAANYLYASRPVVLTDALRDWIALERWTPEFFKREFGGIKFTIGDGVQAKGNYKPAQTGTEYTMARFIDRVLESTEENPAPYFRNQILYDLFPSLKNDIQPLPEYFLPNWLPDHYLVKYVGEVLNRGAAIELYIGGKGGSFPVLHYDGAGTHAFLMQIYGRKEFILYPPEQEEFLYPSPEKENWSLINSIQKPDLSRFPLFAKAVPSTFVLEPGQMAFIPSHWWHTTRMLTPSISISVNVVNQSNWHELVRFVSLRRRNPLVSLAARAYLNVAGARRSWRDRAWRKRVQSGMA
jgi:histone arginine demethylase JMJD6